jgi:TRAP-type C4-dicarboxylate transport system permease large subunit
MGAITTGFFIAAVFLIVGCFLDAIPAIIIVGTILQPIAMAANIDPVHFAIIGIVSLAFGLVTPPYGLCLMICCAVANVRLADVIKDVVLMLLPMLGVLMLVIVWPQLVLFIPNLISPEFLK